MNPRFYPALCPISLERLAQQLGCSMPPQASPSARITGIAEPANAKAGELCFLEDNRRVAAVKGFDPNSVCITRADIESYYRKKQTSPLPLFLIVDSPKLAWCEAIAALAPKQKQTHSENPSIHPSALVSPNARLEPSVRVEAYVVIEDEVEIDANTTIEPFCLITKGCRIGASCRIGANTRISHAIIDDDVEIQSSCNIGEADFGITRDRQGKPLHFPQLGCVRIGRGSRIFCKTLITRGTIEDTCIGEHVHVGARSYVSHNLRIGNCTIIAPRAALSGSTRIGGYATIGGSFQTAQNVRIGDRVGIGGKCSVWPNVRIGDDVKVMNDSTVVKDVGERETLFGNPAIPIREELRRRRELDRLTLRKEALRQ